MNGIRSDVIARPCSASMILSSVHCPSLFSSVSGNTPVRMAVAALFRALSVLFIVAGCRGIDDSCIRCLCEAINEGPKCDYLVGCHDGVCGPYAITMPYWIDAGRPTVGLDDRDQVSTYQNCAKDVTCSEATIRGYMNKFHQDCNQDGYEECSDYAAVHFHGGYNCNQPLREPAKNALQYCLERSEAPPAEPVEQSTYPQIDIRFGDK